MVYMKQPARAFLNSLENAFEGRKEASNQGPKQGAKSLFVGHTSTSFQKDTKDLVSLLHRVCGDGGAYGGEKTIRHDGACVVFLSVGPSSLGLVPNLDLFGSLQI